MSTVVATRGTYVPVNTETSLVRDVADRIALLQPFLEGGQVLMHRRRRPIGLGAGAPDDHQPIAAVLKERPMGKVVKVRGHIGVFVGDSNVTLLYQDNNVLAVYPSEKFVAMDLPAGEEAEAVGTFDVMQYRDREVGVLREARILPSRTTKQVERAQEKK